MGSHMRKFNLFAAVMNMINGGKNSGAEMKIKAQGSTHHVPRQGMSRRTMPNSSRFNGKQQWKVRKRANHGNGVGRSA